MYALERPSETVRERDQVGQSGREKRWDSQKRQDLRDRERDQVRQSGRETRWDSQKRRGLRDSQGERPGGTVREREKVGPSQTPQESYAHLSNQSHLVRLT